MLSSTDLKPSARQVQAALVVLGVDARVLEMPQTTRTAADAAAAIGCSVAQIVKSLVFRGTTTGKPCLILVSGPNRVNEQALGLLIGEPSEKARPDFVRETTGYAIGGVPPIAHATPLAAWLDRSLLLHDVVWAAAGTPESVFPIAPQKLADITNAVPFDI